MFKTVVPFEFISNFDFHVRDIGFTMFRRKKEYWFHIISLEKKNIQIPSMFGYDIEEILNRKFKKNQNIMKIDHFL